jgi:hypothetical protein
MVAVLAGAGLCMICIGCHEPEGFVPSTPPGLDYRSLEQVKEKNEPEALGEQGSVTVSSSTQSPILPGLVPADPTPLGETKTTPGGVKYETLKEGTGAVAKAGQRLTVHYTGTLDDGRKFDSSHDRKEPATFEIGTGKVIKGWDEAVPGMKIGERRKMTIPPALGYGALGSGSSVPPNASLTFVVDLLDVH